MLNFVGVLLLIVVVAVLNGFFWGLVIDDLTLAIIISALTGGAIGFFGMRFAVEAGLLD